MTYSIVLNNIKLPLNASYQEAFSVVRQRLKKLSVSSSGLAFAIYKRSVDARNKRDIFFVYSVMVTGELPLISKESLAKIGGVILENREIEITLGDFSMPERPLIVGAGPAGLFAALILAENGYRPIIIERGESIKNRKKSVDLFNKNGILNPESNIQFGAGGAGTFSDGKLITRINNPLSSYVLKKFVEFGAPEEILYSARPHIGTDILSEVIEKMIEKILSLGAEIRYNTRFIDTKRKSAINVAVTDKGDIPFGVLILAIGHSARDTYKTIIESDYQVEAKSFSVGMRIEHLAEDIDRAMYGDFAGNTALGHAEYNLSYDTKNRGVYTFCMCPGGEVVGAASEDGGVVVNGMSSHSRSGLNSNSAVVCSIFKEDYGKTPSLAIDFQRKIEQSAFKAAGENYSAPYILVGDFLNGTRSGEPDRVLPTYRGGKVTEVMPEKYLPEFVCNKIRAAILDFDRKIKGFASDKAILTGAETRTSAPIRILREETTRLAIGKSDIYPCGEGAGYAGGITSAAIDGISTALAVMKRFKPNTRE